VQGWRAWGRGYPRSASLTVTFANKPCVWGALWLPKESQHPAADTRLAFCLSKHPKLVAAFRGGTFAPGPEQWWVGWAPPPSPGGLDGPCRKCFTASSKNTAPILPKSFPVSSAVCLLFPARRAGRMAARGRLLPYPACARGQGRAGQGAALAAGARGPSPWSLSAPHSLGQDLPSHVSGICTVPAAQHRPRGGSEEPRKPGVLTPCTPITRTHNPLPFHLPFTFSPAFATHNSPPPASLPLPSQLVSLPCPSHLLSLGFPSVSIIPFLPFSISTRSLAPSIYYSFLCFSCPPNPVPFNAIPSTLPHGLVFSIQPHPPGLNIPLHIPLPPSLCPSVPIPCPQPRAHALPAFASNQRSPRRSCTTGI